MIHRVVALMAIASLFWWSPLIIQPAHADKPATDLAHGFSDMITACDAVISRADIDSTAHDHGLTLTSAARAADTRAGANPDTGISAFFGADTQIRSASNQTPSGLALFVVAVDGSKCEAIAFGGADLAHASVEGLTAGVGGWQRMGGEQEMQPESQDHRIEMQRANGDHVTVGTTARAGGVEIVDLKFVRGAANLPLTARFEAGISACNAIISGADIDATADHAGLALSAPSRAADTDIGARSGTGVVEFFGADTQIRWGVAQNLEGIMFFMVSADGAKCEIMSAGRVDTAGALANLFSTGDWSTTGEGQRRTRRADGDVIRVQQVFHDTFNGAFAFFVRGRQP